MGMSALEYHQHKGLKQTSVLQAFLKKKSLKKNVKSPDSQNTRVFNTESSIDTSSTKLKIPIVKPLQPIRGRPAIVRNSYEIIGKQSLEKAKDVYQLSMLSKTQEEK